MLKVADFRLLLWQNAHNASYLNMIICTLCMLHIYAAGQPTVQETAKILVQKLELGPPQTAATQPSRRPPTTTPKNSSRNARNVEGTIDGACKCPDLNPATARYSNTFCRNILPHPRCMRKSFSTGTFPWKIIHSFICFKRKLLSKGCT